MNIRHAFVAAPALSLAYALIRIVDGFDGSRGPGLAWTGGHLAFLAALVLFVPVMWEMRRLAGRTAAATIAAVVGTAGAVAAIAQFAIDIVVGFMAADHEAMRVLSDKVSSVPGVPLVVYQVGPMLFYIGLFALAAVLAAKGVLKMWAALLILAAVLLPAASLDLLPISSLLLLGGLLPLALPPARATAALR